MIRILFGLAFILGALAIVWIGGLFFGTSNLGFWVTALIGVVYGIGSLELLQFRRATNSLDRAFAELAQPVDDLYKWLLSLDQSLQNAVRLRIEGERNGLPAPIMTPYLVGLLVMLGLLGTFVGMVFTLKGAVVALQGTSELEAIRSGLAAPIEGLGLAFGTSVAGVAASAMLGLLSTICRRERLKASHMLDTQVATKLRTFSAKHQQQLAFQAMQDQAQALPEIAKEFSGLADRLEQMQQTINQSMSERLSASQEQFQKNVTELYQELNASVDQSLKTSLLETAQVISSTVQPLTEKTLERLSDAALQTHEHLSSLSEKQLSATANASKEINELMREALKDSFAQQNKSTETLVAGVNTAITSVSHDLQTNSDTLLSSFTTANQQWMEQQRQQAGEFSDMIRQEMLSLREEESKRGSAAVDRLSELEGTVAGHLTNLGKALEEPMTALIETASQTPKAAADVIEKLRAEVTNNLERDNELLSERTQLMEQLDALSKTLEANSLGQREAVDKLVQRSAETLSQVGAQFSDRLEGESSKLAGMVEHFSSSSAEMASLGDAFNVAVSLFSESNKQLMENLTRIEASLELSNTRSDEQLAYYVAQAREIIDHNLLSHKEIIGAIEHAKSSVVSKAAV